MQNLLSKFMVLSKTDTFRRTLGYFALFIVLGLDTGLGGPTLPSLAAQTQTRLGDMGWLFLAGSVGYTLGTLVGGRIFDRVRGHPVLGLSQLAVAVLIAFIPSIPWLWLLLALAVVKGFAAGLVNTGANTLLVWTHEEKASPYMNALHFSFGLGAFLSPFLIAPLLTIEGGYRWAYWALAVIAALVGLRILGMSGSPQPHRHVEGTEKTAPAAIPYPLVITAALFLFFYVGAEITFGGWVYTYAVTLSLATAAGAAYLTSGFWFSFTIGRLISIPAATRFKPVQIIPLALLGCLIILGLGILLPGSTTLIWITSLGLGFFMAPIWPTGFTLAGQSLKLTARASSIILLGDSLGGMVLPWLVGQVINLSGPQVMIYMVFGSLVFNFLAYAGMLRLRKEKTG
ncbi:MAG: MFS transporter [Chloroflexi bacterium]|nr:MAG: MFS transporter [Chloroflexota bacterium]